MEKRRMYIIIHTVLHSFYTLNGITNMVPPYSTVSTLNRPLLRISVTGSRHPDLLIVLCADRCSGLLDGFGDNV